MKREKIKQIICAIIALCVAFGLTAVFIAHEKSTNEKIESIEARIDALIKDCAHMHVVDTLILGMSEYNAKNVEVLEENNSIFESRIKSIEESIREINADLDAYD